MHFTRVVKEASAVIVAGGTMQPVRGVGRGHAVGKESGQAWGGADILSLVESVVLLLSLAVFLLCYIF